MSNFPEACSVSKHNKNQQQRCPRSLHQKVDSIAVTTNSIIVSDGKIQISILILIRGPCLPKGPPFNCFSCCPEQLYTYFEWLHELCNYVNCCIDSDLCLWYLRKSKPETSLPAGGKGKGKGRRGRRSTAVLTQVLSFLNASWSSWCGKNIYGWMLHRGWIGIFGWCEVQSILQLCSHRC